jgi:uncharacterized protein
MATVIAKITERCNSNCAYCDVVRNRQGETMPLEVLGALFERIDEYLRENERESVEMIWHGGEPLLPGVEYYRAAVASFERTCARTRGRIRHAIQTNLTLLEEAFLPHLRALGIQSLGTSYDPIPHIRGPGKAIDSDWYDRRFLEAIALLERHGLRWGMIYVVTKQSLRDPLGIFRFLCNLSPEAAITFNPVLIYDDERRGLSVTAEEHADFLGAIFPVWWANRRRYEGVEPFRALTRTIVEGVPQLGCADSGTCINRHVNVAPDGRTSQCGRSSDWGLLDYGSIADRPLSEILHDEKRAELAARLRVLPESECAGCRLWDICHGGCPLDAWSRHRSFAHKSEWCEARRIFITKYFEPVTGVRYGAGAGGAVA